MRYETGTSVNLIRVEIMKTNLKLMILTMHYLFSVKAKVGKKHLIFKTF